jgi:SAM-dependent methyltransferase
VLARLYHAHHLSYTEDIPFWLDLAAQQGGPLLELGCGTGRVAMPLAQAGLIVYGLDRDAQMLALLRQLLPLELSPRVHLFQADLTAFTLSASFPLILLPCNTFSTFDGSERQAALGCVCRHLAPGGVFAASLPNPVVLAQLPREVEEEVEQVIYLTGNPHPVQVSSHWERKQDGFTLYWHYDTLSPDGGVARQTLQTRHSLDRLAAYQADLQAAGFTEIIAYGDFDRSPYTRRSPNLILCARRAG